MKKRLLLAGLLFGTLLTANAQQITSFETSEGYTQTDINGQKGWYSTKIQDGGNVIDQVVSNEKASVGTLSLKLANVAQYGGQVGQGNVSNPIIGAWHDFATVTTTFEYSFDIYIDAQSANSSTFSAMLFSSETQVGLASRIEFVRDGKIYFVTKNASNQLAFQDTGKTWAVNTWYTINAIINIAAGTTTYTMNGQPLATGVTIGPDVMGMAFLSDNFGGNAYIDNLKTPTGTLEITNSTTLTNFSVYPNPASTVINVGGTDALVNNVSIVDLNGRTVKTAKFNGVANAEVNVADLSAGVYMMTVASDKGTVTKKIVKN